MRLALRARDTLGLLTLALALAGVASAAEPLQWLARMNHALTTLDYQGTFAHWQGGRVEMLRIVHRVKNGVVSERLTSLDGSGREFIRRGEDLTVYLPDRKVALVEHMLPKSTLLGGIPVIDAETAHLYDIREVAHRRIDQQDTRLITVMPRDQYRYGYRLWIDSQGMPLKIQLWDARDGGQVIEQIAFASLEVRPHILDSAFQPDLSTAGYRWLRTEAPPATTGTADWGALWLPPGFHMAMHASQIMPGSPGEVDHLVYTDGLASVSVFVERKAAAPADARPAVESARMGASYVFSTFVQGHRVTAVGEVPARTVRSIVDSVRNQSVAYPPLEGPLPGGAFGHRPAP